ncbi:MAG: hypothetical protein GX944_02170 [Alphaproteobacteria bacterium]|nr:hypothetical protein [Alphaproteobacteria bacterium]
MKKFFIEAKEKIANLVGYVRIGTIDKSKFGYWARIDGNKEFDDFVNQMKNDGYVLKANPSIEKNYHSLLRKIPKYSIYAKGKNKFDAQIKFIQKYGHKQGPDRFFDMLRIITQDDLDKGIFYAKYRKQILKNFIKSPILIDIYKKWDKMDLIARKSAFIRLNDEFRKYVGLKQIIYIFDYSVPIAAFSRLHLKKDSFIINPKTLSTVSIDEVIRIILHENMHNFQFRNAFENEKETDINRFFTDINFRNYANQKSLFGEYKDTDKHDNYSKQAVEVEAYKTEKIQKQLMKKLYRIKKENN